MNSIKTIDAKGSILPDLNSGGMIHPLKARQHNRILSAVVEKPLMWYIGWTGTIFSLAGMVVCSQPASELNTFATNALFLTGDLFLLALFTKEKRINLIVQYAVFTLLTIRGVINNAGVIL
jgi:hypothetical protein